MRIVCPYTPDKICAETRDALERHAPGAELVNVSHHNEAYAGLVEDLWADGEDFAIIEHDIEIHEGVIPAFLSCPGWWCSFPYKIGEGPVNSLGCVRFRAELLRAEPDAVVAHTALGPGGTPSRDWRRLDMRLLGVLFNRPADRQPGEHYQPCQHEPIVIHHHEYAPVWTGYHN